MTFAYVSKGDARFFPGLRALVASLRSFDRESPIFIYDCGLAAEQVDGLRLAGCRVVSMPFQHTSRPQTIQGTHYNDAIYALMHIAKLGVDSFVHLDADTVVFPSIREMAALLDEVEFVGVSDHPALTIGENVGHADQQALLCDLFPLKRELDLHAVNAGVFGARMPAFRELTLVMQRAYESGLTLPRRDQTLLNIALAVVDPTTASLGVQFNFRHFFRRDPALVLSETRLEGGRLQPYFGQERIAVMHYIGPSKPWMDSFDRSSEAFQVWVQFLEKGEQPWNWCRLTMNTSTNSTY